MDQLSDIDPQETREWLDALDGVLEREGPDRAHFLIEQLIDQARRRGAYLPFSANTAYINTIPVERQAALPGDLEIEQRIRSLRALERDGDGGARQQAHQRRRPHRELRLGGRRSTTSASTTSGTRRPTEHGGDLLYIQGHSAPGIYARAFMLGPPHRGAARQLPPGGRRQGHLVLSASVADAGLLAVPDRVDGPRPADGDLPGALHEVPARTAASPTPRAARSGPSAATARWTSPSRWARSAWPAREKLDNLIFVVNCNLQRLDGPVRGNGKIIQELESRVPRRRLERDQGDLGPALGPAARARQERHPAAPDDGGRRRRVPDVQGQGRRLRARALLQHARS